MTVLPIWNPAFDLAASLESISPDPSIFPMGPRLFALADGSLAAVWEGDRTFSVRVLNADGTPKSDAAAVWEQPNYRAITSVTQLSNGNFVVTWQGYTDAAIDEGSGVWAQIFKTTGEKLSSEIHVNLNTRGLQLHGSVTALEGGGFAVAYTDEFGDGSLAGVRTRAFDAAGNRLGAETEDGRVNTTLGNVQHLPVTITLKNGQYVVFFRDSSNSPDDPNETVRGRFYNTDGTPTPAKEFLVPKSGTAGLKLSPAAATLADGKFVVVWVSAPATLSDEPQYIKAQIFNADGSRFGNELVVGEQGNFRDTKPVVLATKDGGFAVGYNDVDTWAYGKPTPTDKPQVKAFTSAGEFASGAQIELPPSHFLKSMSLTVTADGRLMAAWSHQSRVGVPDYGTSFKGQFFDPRTAAIDLEGTSADDQYVGTAFHDSLSGLEGEDQLFGESGDDLLSGGAGDDKIDGGSGTDTAAFSGRKAEYTIVENADGTFTVSDLQGDRDGSDTLSRIKFAQFSDGTVELSSSAVDPAPIDPTPVDPPPTPQPLTRVGTKGRDVLYGGAVGDKLYGGSGNDRLTGGAGQDVFVFNAKLGTATTDRKVNFDTITDFSVKDDTLWLDNKFFTKLGKGSVTHPGKLSGKFFKLGKAKDKNDYVLYDKKTGILSYDADGSGTRYKPVEFAKLAKNLKMTFHDFSII